MKFALFLTVMSGRLLTKVGLDGVNKVMDSTFSPILLLGEEDLSFFSQLGATMYCNFKFSGLI